MVTKRAQSGDYRVQHRRQKRRQGGAAAAAEPDSSVTSAPMFFRRTNGMWCNATGVMYRRKGSRRGRLPDCPVLPCVVFAQPVVLFSSVLSSQRSSLSGCFVCVFLTKRARHRLIIFTQSGISCRHPLCMPLSAKSRPMAA